MAEWRNDKETDQAFSRFGRLSKRFRNRAACLQVEQKISRRRAICANRSNSSFVALGLRKHCGGMAQAALHSGHSFPSSAIPKARPPKRKCTWSLQFVTATSVTPNSKQSMTRTNTYLASSYV